MDFNTPRLLELLRDPAEDLSFEIKDWLNLGENAHKARLAQAIIALANHGGVRSSWVMRSSRMAHSFRLSRDQGFVCLYDGHRQ
jgi:hypothetical protein